MSRVEENRNLGNRRYNNTDVQIAAILYDISKSLAVLADNSSRDDLNDLYRKVIEDDRKLWEKIKEDNRNWNALNVGELRPSTSQDR